MYILNRGNTQLFALPTLHSCTLYYAMCTNNPSIIIYCWYLSEKRYISYYQLSGKCWRDITSLLNLRMRSKTYSCCWMRRKPSWYQLYILSRSTLSNGNKSYFNPIWKSSCSNSYNSTYWSREEKRCFWVQTYYYAIEDIMTKKLEINF